MEPYETCKLCGLEITPNEESVQYSHFINDTSDELYEYSDSSFHKVCFNTWKHKETYQKKFDSFLQETQRIHEYNTGQKIDVMDLMKELLKREKKKK